MSEKTEISAIIVNRNSRELLAGCLSSLAAAASCGITEVIVVDNASEDGSPDMVREKFPGVKLLVNNYNAGFAAANNQALKLACGRYLLLMNNDVSFSGDLPGSLMDFLEKHPRAAMVGPKLVRADGSVQPSVYPRPGVMHSLLKLVRAYLFMPAGLRGRLFSGTYYDYSSEGEVDRISGACLLVRQEAVVAAGPLDEDFFFYGEVHDWCWRMRDAGFEVWYYPGVSAVHYGGRSSALQWDRLRRHKLMLEATFRLYSKHFHRAQKWTVVFIEMLCAASSWLLRLPLFPFKGSGLTGFEASWYARKISGTALGWARRRLLRAFFRGGTYERFYRRRLANLLSRDLSEVDAAFAESETAAAEIMASWRGLKNPPERGGMLELSCAKSVYALVRLLKPSSVLETGVANGVSSFFILEALERNGSGKLSSIDIGKIAGEGFLPDDAEIGWLVPERLRGRWTLEIGSSKKLLPLALERIAKIDLFFHDSAHDYANMRFEYAAAWPYITGGGALVSDDVGFNEAFTELVDETRARHIVRDDRLGIALKRAQ